MKTIIAPGGKLRGYIRECGDRVELLAPSGRALGYYLKTTKLTVRAGGGLVGFGDVLLTLLEN